MKGRGRLSRFGAWRIPPALGRRWRSDPGRPAHAGARMDALAAEMREIRDRLSRLEGKMDFLEGYIVRRNEAEPAAE